MREESCTETIPIFIDYSDADSGVYSDNKDHLMDLELYTGKLEGYMKCLLPISDMVRGTSGIDSCIERYRIIMHAEFDKSLNDLKIP